MTDDEREALARRAEKLGTILPRLRQSGHFTMTVIAAQLRADGERIKALEAALRRMVQEGSGPGTLWAAADHARELLGMAEVPGND